MDQSKTEELFLKAYLIRRTEEKLLELFSEGKLFGTTHACIGQELSAVALTDNLHFDDVIFSNHRCHGHYLGKTGDVLGLIGEIMGKEVGVCKGFGGSQHIASENFFSNGIQGGSLPIAGGISLAKKESKSNNIAVVCIGDGTLGEGVLYETLNIVSKWSIPVLIYMENNSFAQSTSINETLAGEIKARFESFGIKTFGGNTWEFDSLHDEVGKAVEFCKNEQQPVFFETKTYRLCSHSKSDDFRDKSEIAEYEKIDSLNLFVKKAQENESLLASIDKINKEIEEASLVALESDFAEYNPSPLTLIKQEFVPKEINSSDVQINLLNETLHELMKDDERVYLIGEDIESPYGGAFKASRGLSHEFPGRVKNTPISEAAIVGVGLGMALENKRPIIEIMFGDFITLTFDQIVNQSSKFRGMYADKIPIPLIIRTPMGGGRGYGPTHSQCLDKFFAGIPDIDLFVLHGRVDVKNFYKTLILANEQLSIVMEHKLLYLQDAGRPLADGFELFESQDIFPTSLIKTDENPDLTIVAFGGMSLLAEEVQEKLYEKEEVVSELFLPLHISTLNVSGIQESLVRTGKLIVVEEGTAGFNLGSELIAELQTNWNESTPFIVERIASENAAIPSARPLEELVLPSFEKIYSKSKELYLNE